MLHRDPIAELKRQAGAELANLIGGRNTKKVAALLETDWAHVSEIRRGSLNRFSLETLIRYLARLGWRVELRTRPRRLRRPIAETPTGARNDG